MKAAKAQGLIEKIPVGRRAKGLPPRSKDPIIRRGQRLVERAIAALPDVADKPPEQQSDGELFAAVFRLSLLFSREVLDRPDDWSDVQLMRTKKELALSVQGAAVRLKTAELRPASDEGVVARLMERVAALAEHAPAEDGEEA